MKALNGAPTARQAVKGRSHPANQSRGVAGRLLILPCVLLISDVFIWRRAANLLRIRETPTAQPIDWAINSHKAGYH